MDLTYDDRPELFKEIDWINMNDSFLNTIIPSVEGHSKKIDEYLKYKRVEYHRTSVNDLIKFHDPYADDPNWHLKRCYTLLISERSEMGCGIYHLCKRGQSNIRSPYPDFGQYFTITSFRSFCNAAAY